jgi:hypothetical protein
VHQRPEVGARLQLRGLPRSFALPLVSLGALALVRGRPRLLAAGAVAGAALYLPVGLLLATALTLLLLLPQPDAGQCWSARQRAAWLVATAVAMLIVAAPVFVALQPFGPLIGPDMAAAFPEAGPGGRMLAGNRLTDPLGGGPVLGTLGAFFSDLGDRASWGLCAAALLGLLGLALRDAGARRLLLLPSSMVLTYATATLLLPHLYAPGRYLDFVVGPATALGLAAGLAALLRGGVPAPPRSWIPAAITLGARLAVGLLAARNDSSTGGLTVHVTREDRELLDFVARLPPHARVAGWPGGTIEAVPYVTGRRVLVTREVHNPFHRDYVLELRRRTFALIDAYFSTEDAPVRRLFEEYEVTHLLVDFAHHRGEPPDYFRPFDERIHEVAGRPGAGAHLRRLAERSAVWRDGDRVLLDLGVLGRSAASERQPTRGESMKSTGPRVSQ